MIDSTEIEQKSKEFEIHTSNVQRDYVFGWMIFGIFTVSTLKDILFLKGGNALRKGYFSNTRFSSDLDFGMPGDIDSNVLLTEINKVCDLIQEKAGISFVKENNKIEEKFVATDVPITNLRVYEVRVYFKDFYGKADHIKIKISMDITRFDNVLLPIQKVALIHPYSDTATVACEIRCMKLEEIIATKLKCLLQREHAPDLFDYVYTIKFLGGNLNREEVVRTFIQKTIFRKNPHVVKDILLKMPFAFFKESWKVTVICAKQFLFEAEEAIAVFISDLENLFNIFPDNGFRQFAYFSPELRISIMKAGRSQTLLKIRYKGDDRIVEPYSLKYLQTRDGSEKEYFYVFNRQGGNSDPGIRCFVAERIESIENTDEKFEPRYPIELSKAGEKPENPYLFDPNRPLKVSRVGVFRMARPFTTQYIYQCSYCGKRFYRGRMNSGLNPHKNKNGYNCPGLVGYYVGIKS